MIYLRHGRATTALDSTANIVRQRFPHGVAGVILLLVTGIAIAQEPDLPEPSAAEVEEIVQDIRASSQSAEQALRSFETDRLNAELVLQHSDYDAEAIVDWVTDNTRWLPYRGVLRGATGVLSDRRGNSLDRSLLLAQLLEDAGYRTRLARVSLTRSLAEEMVRREAARPAADSIGPALSDAAREHMANAVEQATALAKLAGLKHSARDLSAATDAASDHWWVQMEQNGAWTDIDPLLADADPAHRPSATSWHRPDSLPEDLHHRVAVRVVIERWSDGDLSEEIPVELVVRASTDVAQDLSVDFIPYGANLADNADWQEDYAALIAETRTWLPYIRLADMPYTDMGFNLRGHLETNPEKPAIQRKMGLAVDAIGTLGGQEPAQPASILSAVWIEYEILVPQSATEIIRREIFDLIGVDRRRNGDIRTFQMDDSSLRERASALLGSSQILVVNSEPPTDLLDRALLEFWAHSGHLVAGVIRVAHDAHAQEPRERLASGYTFPLDLLQLAVYRHALSPNADITSLDRPNILGNHYYFLADSGTLARATDIVSNRIAVTSISGDARETRLHQGVLDTVLEAALMPGIGPQHNTAVLFSETRAVVRWATHNSPATASSALSTVVRARIANAIDSGRIVVSPDRLPRSTEAGWWEIDSLDGTTIGIGYRGWGVIAEDPRVHNVPNAMAGKAAKLNGERVCAGIAIGLAAAQALTASDPRVKRTLPSLKAQAKPLLRRHCLVQGWWSPP